MTGLPGKIFRAISAAHVGVKAALLWDAAAELAAQERYVEALAKLERADEVVPTALPPKFVMLKALVCYKLGRYDQAMRSLGDAHEVLSSKKKYPTDEQNYLLWYVSNFRLKISSSEHYSERHSFSIDYGSFDIDKVPQRTRRVFHFISDSSEKSGSE